MNSKRKYGIVALACFAVWSQPTCAAHLAVGAKVMAITNTDTNQSKFTVKVAGGSGPCLGVWITFTLDAAPDADTFKRAYAAVLMALATDLTVSIYNYSSDSCTGASYVEVSR